MYRKVKSIILFCSVCCLFIPDLFAVKLDTAFWIAGSFGGVFDEATVRTIAKTSSDWIVLNFPTNGPTDAVSEYCMKTNIARIRAVKSSLRVLNYCHKTVGVEGPRITWSTLDEDNFYNKPRVQYPVGTFIVNNDGDQYGDFSNTTYTTWFIGRVTNMIYKMNADGVAFDLSMHRDPFTAGLLNPKAVAEGAWRTNYIKGFDRATSNVHTCANSNNGTNNIVIYNGLHYARGSDGSSPDPYLWAQCQVHLMSNYADGAIFEYFGCREYGNVGSKYLVTNSFEEILTQVNMMTNMNALGKRLMVFGRGKTSYVDYQEDYKWQQYLLGCYLLGAFNNHSFKYISSFQATPSGGRSDGLDQYADQFYVPANYLGSAGAYSKITSPSTSSGLYTRVFATGRVLVHPHDSPWASRTYTNTKGITMYDRIGNTYANNTAVTLPRGTAVLLTDDILSSNGVGRYIDFDWTNSAGKHPVEMWSNAVFDDNRLLRCSTAPEWMHDLMIFPVKHYVHQDDLRIRACFRDTNATILALCEVDDSQGTNNYVVFTIKSGTSLGSTVTTNSRPIFRTPTNSLVVPYIPGAICTNTTSYHSLEINADDRFDSVANRYTYRRWVFIRIIGNVTINYILVGDSTNQYLDKDYYYDGQ